MAWFHSWFGLFIGFLLFAVFWMGTLTVFDKEFDRWMHPESRSTQATCCMLSPAQLEAVLLKARETAPNADSIRLRLPTPRTPMTLVRVTEGKEPPTSFFVDAGTGQVIMNNHTLGGSGFFFPFHYKFNLAWKDIGYYLLGIAGLSMLALLISGVVLHRKLLAEFFLFRPKKQVLRSLLDLHNLSSVAALPFHVLITFTGLLIFFSIYFPWATVAVFNYDKAASQQAISGVVKVAASGEIKTMEQQINGLQSIPALVQAREAAWSASVGEPARADSINIKNLADENALVEIRRVFPASSIEMSTHMDTLMLHTGELLHQHETKPVKGFTHWINGLHFIQFDHTLLRILYFLGGLLGCIMIHTGFLFWLESRRAQHHRKGLHGFPLVQGLTVGATAGLMIATAAFLVANQLLPKGMENRAGLEANVFYGVWLLMLFTSIIDAYGQRSLQADAVKHRQRMWQWPTLLFTLLCAMAWLLNQVNTGGMIAAWRLQDMNTLSIDIGLLIMAAGGVYTIRKLACSKKAANSANTSSSAQVSLNRQTVDTAECK